MNVRFFAFIAVPLLLAACMTDPLSTKPETDAKLPETVETPDETEIVDSSPAPVEVEAPAPTAPAPVEPVPVIDPTPEPSPTPTPVVATPVPSTAVQTNSTALLVDHTSSDSIPFTNKLVRGIRNGAILPMKPGETLTLALNANRITGYAWELDGPFVEGGDMEFLADYYREGESPYPDRASLGGARFFIVKANAPGNYSLKIRHVGANDVRATKVITLQVEPPTTE